MSKELWIEVESLLTEFLGRKPTTEEVQKEFANITDALSDMVRDDPTEKK